MFKFYNRSPSRADSRLALSQWETSLQSNVVSHWLDTNLESALHFNNEMELFFPVYLRSDLALRTWLRLVGDHAPRSRARHDRRQLCVYELFSDVRRGHGSTSVVFWRNKRHNSRRNQASTWGFLSLKSGKKVRVYINQHRIAKFPRNEVNWTSIRCESVPLMFRWC